jgi:prophage maintenance system killer protein
MRKRLWYPKIKDIIENNRKVLIIVKASKGDSHKILGISKLDPVIKEVKRYKGDIEDKASILIRGINKAHSFSSGNKRTAFFTANEFIHKNKDYFVLKKQNRQREIAIKIREGRITDKEIADWLRFADKNKIYGKGR